MLKYRFLFFMFLLNLQFLFGQNPKTLKISVYFDTDKFLIRAAEKEKIDKIIDTLPISEISDIFIVGNTDNKADSLYNINLSNNRSRTVKDYFIKKGLDSNLIITSYLGMNAPISSNDTEIGKQKNRRVDISFVYKISQNKSALANQDSLLKSQTDSIQVSKQDSNSQALLVDNCIDKNKDTMIVLPEGTILILNRCEYLEQKDCLVFTEANTLSSMRNNNLQLVDNAGLPLITCGMLDIKIMTKPGCKPCFTNPVKVRFPISSFSTTKTARNCDYCGTNAQLWDLNSSNSWENPQALKIIYENDKPFYEYEVRCPGGWKNCDCRIGSGKNYILKIKTKRAYKLIEANLFSGCPRAMVKFVPKKRPHVAKDSLPCVFPMDSITAKVIDKKGDTLYLNPMPIKGYSA
jgi:OmpA family